MSVTMVSSLPKTSPAQDTDKPTAGTTADGPDFASLLADQLVPAPPTVPDVSDNRNMPDAENPQTDAAVFFAALGMVPSEQGRVSVTAQTAAAPSPQNVVSAETTAADSVAIAGGRVLDPQSKEAPASSDLAPYDKATGEKPAKFADAAFAALKVDSASGKGAPADVTAGNIATLNANVANHVSHSSTRHAAPLAVPTPVQDKGWAGDLGQKIVWMANNNKQSAQLTLNPPQMGPIEISLNVEKGHASASFFSANAEVRDAIETAMPRLREMFASAGIELGQTNVGAESFKQQSGYGEQNRSTSPTGSDNAILVGNVQDPLPSRAFSGQQGNGMVDIFA